MFIFVVAFQASNISAIILSSQTMDTTLVAMFKKSVALEIYPSFGGTSTSDGVQGDSPFGDAYVVSVGFLIILCLTIPMGYFNLDDNIWVYSCCRLRHNPRCVTLFTTDIVLPFLPSAGSKRSVCNADHVPPDLDGPVYRPRPRR